jgi:hypothetical protein
MVLDRDDETTGWNSGARCSAARQMPSASRETTAIHGTTGVADEPAKRRAGHGVRTAARVDHCLDQQLVYTASALASGGTGSRTGHAGGGARPLGRPTRTRIALLVGGGAAWWSLVSSVVFAVSGAALAQSSQGTQGTPSTVERLPVRIVQVAGRSVYFDKGRRDGVVPDLRIRLAPAGGVPFEVRVVVAASSGARAEIPAHLPLPPVGTRGEAILDAGSRARLDRAADGKAESRSVPEHPPWSTDDAGFTRDAPLLVRARGQTRSERPTRWRGREFLHYQFLEDRGGDRRNSYQFGRLGTELEAENPFGRGGALYLEADLDRRGTDLWRGEDASDTRLRLDKLSYAWGIERERSHRGEVGRFISHSVPELGLLDGVETSLRLAGGYRVGGGLGTAPEPLPTRDTGDDLGVHVFAEIEPAADAAFAGLIAFQKTWHHGRDDRDQVFGRLEWTPGDAWRLWSSFRVDIYDSSDRIKGSGAQLTEFWAQAQWLPRFDRGIALSASRYRWAELRRDEVLGVPVALVRDSYVDRLDLSAWFPVAERVRVRLRGDRWQDQDRDGANGEVSVDLREFLDPSGFLFLSAHYSDAAYSSGPTLRGRYSRTLGGSFVSLSYESSLLRSRGFGGVRQHADRHVVRGEYDFGPGDRWDASLGVERTFGDLEDSFGLTLFLQYRF